VDHSASDFSMRYASSPVRGTSHLPALRQVSRGLRSGDGRHHFLPDDLPPDRLPKLVARFLAGRCVCYIIPRFQTGYSPPRLEKAVETRTCRMNSHSSRTGNLVCDRVLFSEVLRSRWPDGSARGVYPGCGTGRRTPESVQRTAATEFATELCRTGRYENRHKRFRCRKHQTILDALDVSTRVRRAGLELHNRGTGLRTRMSRASVRAGGLLIGADLGAGMTCARHRRSGSGKR
jgi:hypothetical protein